MPIDAMSGALHVVLWPQERIQWLRRCGDDGPLEVIFGGPHISQPSLAKVRIGDVICPVGVKQGRLHVLGALRVQRIQAPEAYLMERWGFQRERGMTWNELRKGAEATRFGHRVPLTCADLAAVGTGTRLRWDRTVPAEALAALRFGPKPGKEVALKDVWDGLLTRSLSLQGHLRRASAETAVRLMSLVDADGAWSSIGA
jgi:hypothetical protein